ncbi:glycosyl transferase family protein [Tsuneonella flava]|uniref:Glycosyl transferase family protein n=1 Tax=Tsuneonella flava TaxID=2055955 RepID=A0ABX7K8H5_9SPHN|nr:glycosyl transferase family protein [Tsuneonella flava]QSB44573.1 glycosyl transferase family protein [Tsuneonella flava]
MFNSLISVVCFFIYELSALSIIIFVLGFIDELIIDLIWFRLVMKRRGQSRAIRVSDRFDESLSGKAAVFVAAWRESRVIGPTLRHMTQQWGHDALTIYVGCYPNDPATIDAVMQVAACDPRIRLVMTDHAGPTTKADCLNRLYRALCDDERRSGVSFRMVVIHDAEDMVDRAAMGVFDRAMDTCTLVQLPVIPAALPDSRWIGSHYCEEFAEAHTKTMLVRDAIGAGIPTAGVGCAIARPMLGRLSARRGMAGPFDDDSLTEDYALGLEIAALGGRSRFLRCRTPDGRLVATPAAFPSCLDMAVRQKARWIQGISFQSWDRLGWGRTMLDMWMRMRDRRGPLAALALVLAYLTIVWNGVVLALGLAGVNWPPEATLLSPAMRAFLWLMLFGVIWRAIFRFGFTAHEYGLAEGGRALLRIPVANIIAIMAGRRALWNYLRTLRGHAPRWDKTSHRVHPDMPDARATA